jgi:hypothetical protein
VDQDVIAKDRAGNNFEPFKDEIQSWRSLPETSLNWEGKVRAWQLLTT